MQAKYKYLIAAAVISTSLSASYVEQYKFRKRKGILKMAQIYLRESVGKDSLKKKRELKNQIEKGYEMHLYHASRLEYLKYKFYNPYAILFPRRLESVQKIMKIAHKYNVGVLNLDMEEFEQFQQEPSSIQIYPEDYEYIEFFSDKPFILINQKLIDHIQFDEENQTCIIGCGNTLKSINDYLKPFNYELPFEANPNTRLFTLFNKNQDTINFKTILHGLTVVLPDGTSLQATPHQIPNSFSHGIDFSNLFVGQNANNGIIVDVELKVFPIQERIQSTQIFNNSYLTQNNIYYLVNGIYEYLQQNHLYRCNLSYEHGNLSLNIIDKQKIDVKKMLEESVHRFVYRQFWEEKEEKPVQQFTLTDDKNNQVWMSFQFDRKSLFQSLFNVERILRFDIQSVNIDFINSIMKISLISKEIGKLREITTYFNEHNCRFIYCTHEKINLLLKQESLPYECGLNHLNLTQSIKNLLDKKRIILNDNFRNQDL